MTLPLDQNTGWYTEASAHGMNKFYDNNIKNHDVSKHLAAFTTLLARTHLENCLLIDLGCGTAMLSEFCKEFTYHGADLPNALGICAMRNYPQYYYRACDLTSSDLSWIKTYPIAVLNGVIDIMQTPLEVLERVLANCKEYLIIHRQEITEAGHTHTKDGPGYAPPSYHSVISRKDFNELVDRMHFDVVQEVALEFGNWENGGSSFLLRRRKTWALYEMDYKLYEKYFRGKENGFFIEAGANDGLEQSNTYYLEFHKNWRGILIEPVAEKHFECKRNRSQAAWHVHKALVAEDYDANMIDMIYTPECKGLLSVIDDENAEVMMRRAREKGIPMVVKTTTLNQVLEDFTEHTTGQAPHIDLLVLDVEGYELNALKGLSLDRWQIDYILVEELQETDIIQNHLQQFGYQRIDKLSEHDYLYKKV